MPRPSLGQCLHSPRELLLRTKLSLPVPDWSTSWSRTRCLLNTRLSLPRADLGLYHGPRPNIYHSTEWSLNTGLSLHRSPGPGGPILRREGLSMLLRKINTPSQRERHSLPYQACHESTRTLMLSEAWSRYLQYVHRTNVLQLQSTSLHWVSNEMIPHFTVFQSIMKHRVL